MGEAIVNRYNVDVGANEITLTQVESRDNLRDASHRNNVRHEQTCETVEVKHSYQLY